MGDDVCELLVVSIYFLLLHCPLIAKFPSNKHHPTTKNEIVGWHHWLNGHEFEQVPGDGEGQRWMACCSPWGHKDSDTSELLNNNNKEGNKWNKWQQTWNEWTLNVTSNNYLFLFSPHVLCLHILLYMVLKPCHLMQVWENCIFSNFKIPKCA